MQYLSDQLEKLQRRAFGIIFPDMRFKEVLETMNISTLYDRRQSFTGDLFHEIFNNSHHELNALLPLNGGIMPLRSRRNFQLPLCKTNRFKNNFIMSNSYRYFK